MIKIFENADYRKLEKEVNDYIKECGYKIENIQFTSALVENELMLHCFIVHDLSFINQYK